MKSLLKNLTLWRDSLKQSNHKIVLTLNAAITTLENQDAEFAVMRGTQQRLRAELVRTVAARDTYKVQLAKMIEENQQMAAGIAALDQACVDLKARIDNQLQQLMPR